MATIATMDTADLCPDFYLELNKMIRTIIQKVATRKIRDTLEDELFNEAWLIVLSAIPQYQADSEAKLTTFLWDRVFWRLRRFVVRNYARNAMIQNTDCTIFTTESSWDEPFLECNPYHNTPDVVYETKEKYSLWKRLKQSHPEAIHTCTSNTRHANSAKRSGLCKRKKRLISVLQKALQSIS